MLPEFASYIHELRQSFRVADAIDICVIASLLYAVMVWFRQSASRGLVVGVTLTAVLYFLARGFDMYLTLLVFHAGFAVLLLVLVVLFQEEIRRVFERVASWGTLRELRPQESPLVREADTLVEAAFAMAAKRIGALIVLTGREPLERHVHGGIDLSGRISKPILFSIFDPGSIGHDGAVIVERDRLRMFAAHLPISKNHAEIRGRGTRHSAALGLSERSDALTIVVSEERGVVSIAEDSRLVEMKTAADLKDNVEKFVEDRFPQELEDTWKRFVTHDITSKLVALCIAILAWFVLVFSAEKVQTSVVVPIEYRNLPANALIDASTPADALVTLSGSERAFRLLDRRVLKISLDLAAANGAETIQIKASDVRMPPNLQVNRIQPNQIRVRLKIPPPVAPPPRINEPTGA